MNIKIRERNKTIKLIIIHRLIFFFPNISAQVGDFDKFLCFKDVLWLVVELFGEVIW